jgi:hypothetical protein
MQSFKIDPDGKYLLIVEGEPSLPNVVEITTELNNWWESDEKFCIVEAGPYRKVRVERLEKPENNP